MKDILRYGIDEGFIAFYVFESDDPTVGLAGRAFTQKPLRIRVDLSKKILTVFDLDDNYWPYPISRETLEKYGTLVENDLQAIQAIDLWNAYNFELSKEMKQINLMLS